MKRSRFPLVVTWLLLAFFYLPIVVLVVNSFNGSRFGGALEGLDARLVPPALRAPRDLAGAGQQPDDRRGRDRWSRSCSAPRRRSRCTATTAGCSARTTPLIYTPLVVPEILMGISLLLFFAALGLELGLFTIFLAHVTFCVSYVAMVVLGRLQDFDDAVIEAAPGPGRRLVDDHVARAAAAARPGHRSPAACSPSPSRSTTS